MLQSQVLRMVQSRLSRLYLPVALKLWDGQELHPDEQAKVTLKINGPQGLFALAKPNLGKLARGYVNLNYDFSGPMRDIIHLGEHFCGSQVSTAVKPRRALSWWKHSKPSDRKNIRHHYDVSNDFYALWLDERRVYSCAYFKTADDTLARARTKTARR